MLLVKNFVCGLTTNSFCVLSFADLVYNLRTSCACSAQAGFSLVLKLILSLTAKGHAVFKRKPSYNCITGICYLKTVLRSQIRFDHLQHVHLILLAEMRDDFIDRAALYHTVVVAISLEHLNIGLIP